MAATAPTIERLHEALVHEGQVRHALKTGLACVLATFLAHYFHLSRGQLAPIFVFVTMILGMPSPRLNWALIQVAVGISATVSALILLSCGAATYLYLALTLLWIFICVLFATWFPLPATMAAMLAAIGIFVNFHGTVGGTLNFYVDYGLNFLVAGFSVVVVHTLLWPLNTRKVFLRALGEVYARLEGHCRRAAHRIRTGEALVADDPLQEWAPFRPLRQLLAPELRRTRDTSNPFARMILACRALNLRLWFFNQTIAPMVPAALSPEVRQALVTLLEICAGHLHALFEGAVNRQEVSPVNTTVLQDASPQPEDAAPAPVPGEDFLLTLGIHHAVLHQAVEDLQTVTASHNALLASLHRGLAGDLATLTPVVTSTPLITETSVHSATKLVLMILLLLVGEMVFGLPGGSQVAFFATFFASTGNLGRQNKTDLVGLAGLLTGFAYGVGAAIFTSRLPYFPLLLALVFLGEYLATLAYQVLPRYGIAGFQAGLALPFAYLATTGPEWGSFASVQTRFAGLVVAGFAAIVIHAYLWPVLPMRQLRAFIATALRDTAASLGRLFSGPGDSWEGSPPSLTDTLSRARDLLDDARYLPGPDHADPDYNKILANLQEIDANLEFISFLHSLGEEDPLREKFYRTFGDYAEQAHSTLESVAQQFHRDSGRAALLAPVRWQPEVSSRWEQAVRMLSPPPHIPHEPGRSLVIARSLDQIAQATERISALAREINSRYARF